MNVLLAVDGSESALRATRTVIASAALCREPVHVELVTVHLPVPPVGGFSNVVVDQAMIDKYYKDEGEGALAGARRLLDAAGVSYTPHILVGEIAETISKHAAGASCRTICMGTRGMTAIANLVMGSVATRVVHHAQVPVVLVPDAARPVVPRSIDALATVIAVNVTPLAGILILGWRPEAVLLSYFVDTYLGFGAVLVLLMIHVTGDEHDGPIVGGKRWAKAIAGMVFLAAILAVVVGFPLFFVFGDDGQAWSLFADRTFLAALAMQCLMSVYAAMQLHRELNARGDDDRVLAGRLFFLAARWIAMFMAMVVGLGSLFGPRFGSLILVAIYAGASVYFELYPERAMRFVRGKDTKPVEFTGDLDSRLAGSGNGTRRPASPSDTVQRADRNEGRG